MGLYMKSEIAGAILGLTLACQAWRTRRPVKVSGQTLIGQNKELLKAQ
jgi:hypothetical protein